MDDEALTEEQLAELRGVLLAKRRDLLALLSHESEALGSPASAQSDLMDQADRAAELDEHAHRTTREGALLGEIDHALAKFDDGTYGASEDSGESIGYGRLRAVPWARRTVREEEELERR